jgi:hypothetical protein
MTWYALATEDALSEAVALKLIRHIAPTAELGVAPLGRRGNGYLHEKRGDLIRLSYHYPVIVVTDLDDEACAGSLISKWLGNRKTPKQFLLRVAVREIESWLLADDTAMRALLGRHSDRLPVQCDTLPDPKQTLLQLAWSAGGSVRRDLCASPGSAARQGLGYNRHLCDLVQECWEPARARHRSESLNRACLRLSAQLNDS